MNDIRIFDNPEFGKVRTVMIDGEPWFVAKDVAKSLGYKNTNQSIKDNTEEDDRGVSPVATPSGNQNMVILNESGLYSLIFCSKLESAKKFKRWVTSEVLPQLRKNGTYELSNNPLKLLEVHYEAIKQVNQKVETLEERFDEFEQGLPLFPSEADIISDTLKKRVVKLLGGKESNAYRNVSLRRKVFIDAYRELKRNFTVRSYKAIKRNQHDRAIKIIEQYELPRFLADQIKDCNSQIKISIIDGKVFTN